MVPEEIKSENQKYKQLLVENGRMQTELCNINLRYQCLMELTQVQSRVIDQLQKLKNMTTTQTKIKCPLGHYSCRINHGRYNYFKPCQENKIQMQYL